MPRYLPTKPPEPGDWIVDIRFHGRKTGKELCKCIGVSPHVTEDVAILTAWAAMKIDDPARVIDTTARRRTQVEARSTSVAKFKMWRDYAQKYVKT